MLVCGNVNCIYRAQSGDCRREIPMFNQFGMCEVFFEKNGMQKNYQSPPEKTKEIVIEEAVELGDEE